MKRICFLAFLSFCIGFGAQAQDTIPHWTKKGNVGLHFAQSSFTNWAAGGQNVLSWVSSFNYTINYAKDNFKWDNSLNAAIGYSYYDFEYDVTWKRLL